MYSVSPRLSVAHVATSGLGQSIVTYISPQEIRNPNFENVPNSDVFIYIFSIFWHIAGNFSYYYAIIVLDGLKPWNDKLKETLLIRDLKPALNENVGSEKLLLY